MASKEHPQMDFLEGAFRGAPPTPSVEVLSPTGTPNQQFLGTACMLACARVLPGHGPTQTEAHSAAMSLFQLMTGAGHQAVGESRRNEQGAPEPHSELWLGALGSIAREAHFQGLHDLEDWAVGYFADHLRLCAEFWTPAGPRMPCARALAAPGQALSPNWDTDAAIYEALGDRALGPRVGKTTPFLRDLLADLAAWMKPLLAKRTTTASDLPLRLPIRKWDVDGGFIAAYSEEEQQNDPLAWLQVDAAGRIVRASRTLSDFVPPASTWRTIGARPVAASKVDAPLPAIVPVKGKELSRMTLDFGHALATLFPLSRYIPQENVHAVNTLTFSPQATFYRNRYGVQPASVKGFPDDQMQHGFSTFWLGPLLANPSFLAAHPEWTGVTVTEPLSIQDYTDLCFAASTSLGGAYAWLRDQADMLGLLGNATATGPLSSPGAPGVPPATPVVVPVPPAALPPVVAPPQVPTTSAPVPLPSITSPSPLPAGAPAVSVTRAALAAAIDVFVANDNPSAIELALAGPLVTYVRTGKINKLAVAVSILALAEAS